MCVRHVSRSIRGIQDFRRPITVERVVSASLQILHHIYIYSSFYSNIHYKIDITDDLLLSSGVFLSTPRCSSGDMLGIAFLGRDLGHGDV